MDTSIRQKAPHEALIDRLAARIVDDTNDSGEPLEYTSPRQRIAFAQLVAEECAKVCEQWDATHPVRLAAEIRATFGIKA